MLYRGTLRRAWGKAPHPLGEHILCNAKYNVLYFVAKRAALEAAMFTTKYERRSSMSKENEAKKVHTFAEYMSDRSRVSEEEREAIAKEVERIGKGLEDGICSSPHDED